MSAKKYTSNYDYIKGCSVKELAEMMSTLTLIMYSNITGKEIDAESLELNSLKAEEWLNEPVVQGEYLN